MNMAVIFETKIPPQYFVNFLGCLLKIMISPFDNPRKTQRFKRQSHKMVKHTQTIRRQFADEFFECV